MVEEYQPEREAAEQIKPQIAFGRYFDHERLFFHRVFQP